MPQAQVKMNVRKANANASIIDVEGEVTAFAEDVLIDACNEACAKRARVIALNFENLEYMNSSGIGLLVTLLIRINREKLLTYGPPSTTAASSRSHASTTPSSSTATKRKPSRRRARCKERRLPTSHPPQSKIMPINASTRGMPVYAGVMVLYADGESFTVMTAEGHPEAGRNSFSACEDEDVTTVAQTEESTW